MKQKKIFIGICNSQNTVLSEFFWSITPNLENDKYAFQIVRSTHPWDVVRNNRLIWMFLQSECEIFVKMDVDQRYPRGFFNTMVPLVDEYKVVGPLIHDRWAHNDYMPLAFESVNYPALKKFDITGMSGVVDIPYSHTNLFYAREVLEKIKAPYYEAYLTADGMDRANHVDFTFLDKIKDAGYPIYINLDCKVDHQTECWA